MRPNYLRRTIGAAVCFAPVGLAMASLVAPSHAADLDSILLLAAGAWLGWTNFHLSFVRPWLYKRRHGSYEGYQFISGFPVIGNVFVCLALLSSFGSGLIAMGALIALAFDTGGLPWFLAGTSTDSGMWDGPSGSVRP